MAHSQSSPRGYWAKKRFDVGAQSLTDGTTYLALNLGLALSAKTSPLTQNSTGLVLPGGLRHVGGNSTAFSFSTETGLPATDGGNYKWTFVVNSSGVAGLAINTTGTTWKYCRMTGVINNT